MVASIDAAQRIPIHQQANTASSKPQVADARNPDAECTLDVDDLQSIAQYDRPHLGREGPLWPTSDWQHQCG
jgi:hypothetical protein